MFKKIFFISTILIFSFLAFQVQAKHNLGGKILLQVEANGEAYYFHPESLELHFLGRPDDAFAVMREQGIGISNENLLKIPVADASAFEDVDSDEDGYDDYTELNNGYNPYGEGKITYDQDFASRNAGKIFLQVENNGEAWYINPEDNKRYFLGRPADAFEIMRTLGLGISNDNLDILLAINEEEEIIEEEEEEEEVLEDEKLLFAHNLFSDCQEMGYELLAEGSLYNLTCLGLTESGNYCNIEVSILNEEEFSGKSMTCKTPTIEYYLSQLEEGDDLSEADYLEYVDWLPMMYGLDIEENQGEGNCSGSLVKAILAGEDEEIDNPEIISNSLNWQLIDQDYIVDVYSSNNTLYILEQTVFADEAQSAIFKYENEEKTKISETLELATDIFVDSQKRVWVYNKIEGIGLHMLVNNNWYQFSEENSDLISDKINRIGENEEGIWIATDKGLNLLKNGNWILYNYPDWYPEDSLTENNIKDLEINENYLLFSTAFESYIFENNAFIRLEGANLGENIYLQDTSAWYYDNLNNTAVQLNLEDFSSFELVVEPDLEELSAEDFWLKDIMYYNDAYWFLAVENNMGDDIVLVKLEDNTAYYYYSKYEHGHYANQLINFNNDLYIKFSNGFGLYKVSEYDI